MKTLKTTSKVYILMFAGLAAALCVQCYPSPADQQLRRMNAPGAQGAALPPAPLQQQAAADAANQETLKGESSYGYGYAYPYYGYYYPRYYAYGYGYPYYSYYSHYWGWPYYR